MLKVRKVSNAIVIGIVLSLTLPLFVFADTPGQVTDFFVEKDYDGLGRNEITATLKIVSQKAYFYVDRSWYQNLSDDVRHKVETNLDNLSQEFDKRIYPTLTSLYGKEWSPGIDNDTHITILFEKMKEGAGGYFRTEDEYQRIQAPNSNQREMIYVNAIYLPYDIIKSYVSHEFTHLITFNQKDRLRGVSEETWLNEMRADYSPTLMGYDKDYRNSNLQQRVKQFIQTPSDSLTEWQERQADYGVINLFGQYLVEHYGVRILADSMHSREVGMSSIDEALAENGFKETFSDIFTDWTVAVFLNDCALGQKYCYTDKSLKNIRVAPSLVFLPSTQMTSVDLNYAIKQWSGHWYRIMGGEGDLSVKFKGQDSVKFAIPYVLCKDTQDCQVKFLKLDRKGEGEISLPDFGKKWTSLTLIPSIQLKRQGFDSAESLYHFSIKASMEFKSEKEKLIEALQARIAALKAKIAQVQAQIADILKEKISSQRLTRNLYFGMRNSDVYLLQEFLKMQGPEIYPEGLVTGFFGPLTKAAVVRFQEKYAGDILLPLGLEKGTGFVGMRTRAKINQLLTHR